MSDGRYEATVAAIDALNADDPVAILHDGVVRPKELVHAEAMVGWVERLDPGADVAQRLAARAHHLRRWSIPRSSYPDGRKGYLRWRTVLRKQHTAEVGAVLRDNGWDDVTIERVRAIVGKVGLGTDPAVQVHEDALCLVFMELQLAELVDRLGDDKALDVIAKTAAKMSAEGLALVGSLPLRDHDRDLIEQALGG